MMLPPETSILHHIILASAMTGGFTGPDIASILIGVITLVLLAVGIAFPLLISGRKARQENEIRASERFVQLDEVVKSNNALNDRIEHYIEKIDGRLIQYDRDIARLQALVGDNGSSNGRLFPKEP